MVHQPPTQKPLNKSAVSHSDAHAAAMPPTPARGGAHLRLAVVLQGHGDDIDADDEGDDQIQVVAGAQGVDGQAGAAVGGVVRQLLGLWGGLGRKERIRLSGGSMRREEVSMEEGS